MPETARSAFRDKPEPPTCAHAEHFSGPFTSFLVLLFRRPFSHRWVFFTGAASGRGYPVPGRHLPQGEWQLRRTALPSPRKFLAGRRPRRLGTRLLLLVADTRCQVAPFIAPSLACSQWQRAATRSMQTARASLLTAREAVLDSLHHRYAVCWTMKVLAAHQGLVGGFDSGGAGTIACGSNGCGTGALGEGVAGVVELLGFAVFNTL
jgi:hypothetical protein